MGAPAVVANDRIVGVCAAGMHQVPSPSGSPMPSPGPLPFSAPLTDGLAETVTIGGKAAAVEGSSGQNSPAHIGLHPSDPYQQQPDMQKGEVTKGSRSVTFDGKPAAYTGCKVVSCSSMLVQVVGSATTVLVAQ
jgi:uncharacterized Zn-binding protein involved in type VI secretion